MNEATQRVITVDTKVRDSKLKKLMLANLMGGWPASPSQLKTPFRQRAANHVRLEMLEHYVPPYDAFVVKKLREEVLS